MQNNLEIKTGRVYSAKRPKIIRLPFEGDFYNDRQVIYFDGITVQYDSLEVKPGQNYPKVPLEKFQKWANEDITESMPKVSWRKAD